MMQQYCSGLWFQLWHCYAKFEVVYTLNVTIAVELKIASRR